MVKEKLGNTTQVVLKQEAKLKDPLLIELPLVLPTSSQIQELSTQFLHISSQDIGHLWNSAEQLGISSAPQKPSENSTQQGWHPCRKGNKLPETALSLCHKSSEDLTTHFKHLLFPFQVLNPPLFSCCQWPAQAMPETRQRPLPKTQQNLSFSEKHQFVAFQGALRNVKAKETALEKKGLYLQTAHHYFASRWHFRPLPHT